MSQYRAYFVPGAVDPLGLYCNIHANVDLELRATFITGSGEYPFDISGQAMIDFLVSEARGALLDKLKDKIWKRLKRQISGGGQDLLDALNDAADKFGDRNKRAKLEGLHLSQWFVKPVYTISYRWLCCGGGSASTSGTETFTTEEGREIVGLGKFYPDEIHFNNPTDRKKLIQDIVKSFNGVQKRRPAVLKSLRQEATRKLISHAKTNVSCCKKPRVVELGGLGRPAATIVVRNI